ncbi:MAG TPA: hypothetical protein VD865_13335 [Stenotrophomonas sp.]|nr:hypothetical protein [Stenotrophomonas sp.]
MTRHLPVPALLFALLFGVFVTGYYSGKALALRDNKKDNPSAQGLDKAKPRTENPDRRSPA